MEDTISTLATELAQLLTHDRSKEMSAHAQFYIETRTSVFFADPKSAASGTCFSFPHAGSSLLETDLCVTSVVSTRTCRPIHLQVP